jgi:hypothetical protein
MIFSRELIRREVIDGQLVHEWIYSEREKTVIYIDDVESEDELLNQKIRSIPVPVRKKPLGFDEIIRSLTVNCVLIEEWNLAHRKDTVVFVDGVEVKEDFMEAVRAIAKTTDSRRQKHVEYDIDDDRRIKISRFR